LGSRTQHATAEAVELGCGFRQGDGTWAQTAGPASSGRKKSNSAFPAQTNQLDRARQSVRQPLQDIDELALGPAPRQGGIDMQDRSRGESVEAQQRRVGRPEGRDARGVCAGARLDAAHEPAHRVADGIVQTARDQAAHGGPQADQHRERLQALHNHRGRDPPHLRSWLLPKASAAHRITQATDGRLSTARTAKA
jgi:hypothetical protein